MDSSYKQAGHFIHEKGKNKRRKVRWNKVWGEGRCDLQRKVLRWRRGKWRSLCWLSSWFSEKQAHLPFPWEGGWVGSMKAKAEIWKGHLGDAMWVSAGIRSPGEQLWSETHLGSNPSSDIPDLCDFGQGTSLLCAKVSSPRKQDNSSTYHIGGGEDWTAWPMWKQWG